MNDEKEKCIVLRATCTTEEFDLSRIQGINSWTFDFYVLKEDAVELMLHILNRLSNNKFKEFGIHFGREVLMNKSNIWTKDAIDMCLNNNLGLESEKELILNKKDN